MKKLKCDCAQCPLAWEEGGYGDWDAGCHFYDELYVNKIVCFLPGFIRRFLYKRQRKLIERQYEQMFKQIQEQEKKAAGHKLII